MSKQPQYCKTPQQPAYATEYPWRTPQFKTLGHARGARSNHWPKRIFAWGTAGKSEDEATIIIKSLLAARPDFDIYKWDGQGWVHMPEESISAEMCELTISKSTYGHWHGIVTRKEAVNAEAEV
jgi:hypothetical protein